MEAKTDRSRRRDQQQERELDPQLQRVLDEVGPAHYANATAAHFARGGKFNKRPRQRYAIT